ncbi:hypothetical protein [Intrasporangium sp. YIM S08009]|uniref:hypothetical protein n=1 Tax=Intrasporangium zincisolvens TaxID=3080018 RepID=UPI002B0610EF|nr:hypothetical protein [Intrasporangium sp. YIM S08009]
MKRRFLVQTPVRRRVSALAAGVALAAVTAGCQVNSPVQTDVQYVPADGVPADVGQLAVRNLVLVGEGNGPAVVTGSAINLGTDQMTVKFQPQAAQGAATAPTGSEVSLGPREQVDLATKGLQISGVTSKPGTLVPVTITSSTGGTTVAEVPVLPATGYYSTATPAPTGGA